MISVIMPTYKQASFICRALDSLFAQRLDQWELIIIDDGSPDDTAGTVKSFTRDSRIKYIRHTGNKGLGACLNEGIEHSGFPFIAYLPSDDIYYKDHLQQLFDTLHENENAVLAYSGVRYNYNREAPGKIEGSPLQLVQVLHRKTGDRWMERKELVTDDLHKMFWKKLEDRGAFAATGKVSCEWVDHQHQRHKIIREPAGGINPYRSYYNVKHPLRFHSSVGNFFDEEEKYRRFRERPSTPMAKNGLKIVLAGDLGYVPERVLALEERGNKLYGLWMKEPHWYTHLGPVPFGHIEDIDRDNWKKELQRIKPDIIYALLDWQSVPFAHEILENNPGIPFTWNLKEGPFICLRNGTWSKLIDLYTRSDGQIYPNPEMKAWFASFIPGLEEQPHIILDGDLPKKDWFTDERVKRLSDTDGELHTVVPGRPIGLHPHVVKKLAEQKIHLHVYGDVVHEQWKEWIDKVNVLAPGYLHIHPNVEMSEWTKELSKYDAGWLHYFQSRNFGELRRMDWDDLNYPARFAPYAFAGLPMIQKDNEGHIVAMQSLIKQMDIGIFIKEVSGLGEKLRDKKEMQRLSENVWRQRWFFTFDHHADRLLDFFREVIDVHRKGRKKKRLKAFGSAGIN